MDKEYFDTNRLNDLSIMEVARRLGDTLKREGSVYKTRCPWHEDSHPSLTFYERTGESRCHCFACGNGGSVISYVMQHEKWTFQEACQWLSNGFGILTTKSGKTYIPSKGTELLHRSRQSRNIHIFLIIWWTRWCLQTIRCANA